MAAANTSTFYVGEEGVSYIIERPSAQLLPIIAVGGVVNNVANISQAPA